jgi:hypothetical protein
MYAYVLVNTCFCIKSLFYREKYEPYNGIHAETGKLM